VPRARVPRARVPRARVPRALPRLQREWATTMLFLLPTALRPLVLPCSWRFLGVSLAPRGEMGLPLTHTPQHVGALEVRGFLVGEQRDAARAGRRCLQAI